MTTTPHKTIPLPLHPPKIITMAPIKAGEKFPSDVKFE